MRSDDALTKVDIMLLLIRGRLFTWRCLNSRPLTLSLTLLYVTLGMYYQLSNIQLSENDEPM